MRILQLLSKLHLTLRLLGGLIMSLRKIWSNREVLNLGADSEVQRGDLIYWHYAIFKNLMNEKATMVACSLLSPKLEQGNYGITSSNGGGTKWFLKTGGCLLGEKSIWQEE